MKYIKVYIKAGRHSHKKLEKQVKSVDWMNIKIYSESSLYIREEYKYLLLQFLNKKKHIFFFLFLNILWSCYITIQKAFFTTICSFKPKNVFFDLFTEVLKRLNVFMTPFYGWGSTVSRLEPLRGGSLLFTTKFPEIPGTHFIDLGRMNSWVDLGATQWFWAQDTWVGDPAP